MDEVSAYFQEQCGDVVNGRMATMGSRLLCWLEFGSESATHAALSMNEKSVPALSPHRLKVVRSRNPIQQRTGGGEQPQPRESTREVVPPRKDPPAHRMLCGASLFPTTSSNKTERKQASPEREGVQRQAYQLGHTYRDTTSRASIEVSPPREQHRSRSPSREFKHHEVIKRCAQNSFVR